MVTWRLLFSSLQKPSRRLFAARSGLPYVPRRLHLAPRGEGASGRCVSLCRHRGGDLLLFIRRSPVGAGDVVFTPVSRLLADRSGGLC